MGNGWLVKAGKVRWIGASNYDAALLTEALATSADLGLPRYETLQNEFNLYTRDKYEGAVQTLVMKEGLSLIPYYSLAAGFLTGKYRSESDLGKSARGEDIAQYLNARGLRILAALDVIAANTHVTPAEVALAWVSAQPGVVGPLASATSVAQLESLARGAHLTLTADDLATLTASGAGA